MFHHIYGHISFKENSSWTPSCAVHIPNIFGYQLVRSSMEIISTVSWRSYSILSNCRVALWWCIEISWIGSRCRSVAKVDQVCVLSRLFLITWDTPWCRTSWKWPLIPPLLCLLYRSLRKRRRWDLYLDLETYKGGLLMSTGIEQDHWTKFWGKELRLIWIVQLWINCNLSKTFETY